MVPKKKQQKKNIYIYEWQSLYYFKVAQGVAC